MDRAHHIGGPGGRGLGVAAAHQGLGGQVQHKLRAGFGHELIHQDGIANVAEAMLKAPLQLQLGKQAGIGFGRQGKAGDLRPELQQPQGQPAPLEAGVAREQHTAATPEGRIRGHQRFQGGLPLSQSSSR